MRFVFAAGFLIGLALVPGHLCADLLSFIGVLCERQKPAVSQKPVVCPVRQFGARAVISDRQPVHGQKRDSEDRKRQYAVRDDPVDAVGKALLLAGLHVEFHAFRDKLLYELITLGGDDGLRVVVQFLFAVHDVVLDVLYDLGIDVQLLYDLLVPFEDLDGIPADGVLGDYSLDGLLNVRQGVLHRTAEDVGSLLHLALLGVAEHGQSAFLAAYVFLSADAHDFAAEAAAQFFQIIFVPSFADEVHHVDSHHHGNAQFRQLRRQVKVSFYIGAVNDIQYAVGAFLHQILSGNALFQRIGRKRIDAGQVLDHKFFVAFIKAFLFLNGDARPVAHVLVRSGQVIEKRRLAAVGVTG